MIDDATTKRVCDLIGGITVLCQNSGVQQVEALAALEVMLRHARSRSPARADEAVRIATEVLIQVEVHLRDRVPS